MSKVIEDYGDIMKNYDPTKNVTRNVLSRYEKTKIIGLRLEQLARGATPYIDPSLNKVSSIRDIVMLELEKRKLPFMLARTLPNGIKEYWRLDDLMI